MINCVFAAADVKSVAVSQKGFAAAALDFVNYGADEDGAQIGIVALFSEMKLDRGQRVL